MLTVARRVLSRLFRLLPPAQPDAVRIAAMTDRLPPPRHTRPPLNGGPF